MREILFKAKCKTPEWLYGNDEPETQTPVDDDKKADISKTTLSC